MPLVGVKCPCQGGDPVDRDFAYCLSCARTGAPHTCNYPLALIKFMANKEDSRKGIGQSATGIISCPRQNILLGVEDYFETPDLMYPLFSGDVWHMGMEHWLRDEPDLTIETRYERTIDVEFEGVTYAITLSGKPDEHGARATGELVLDHKKISRTLECKDDKDKWCLRKPYPEHEQQINIYAWILADGYNVATGEQIHRRVTAGGIVYADPKTTRKMAVRIWDLDEQEAFIRTRLLPRVVWEATGAFPAVLPATLGKTPATGEVVVNRHWKCLRCPVKTACDAQALKESGAHPDTAAYWQMLRRDKA